MPSVKQKMDSLPELLSGLTKDELQSIRRFLEVQGGSQLNKSDLVEFLSAHMLERFNQHLERLDHERYSIMKQVMNAPGAKLSYEKLAGNESYDSVYFQSYGFLFYKGNNIVMPEEIRERLLQANERHLKEIFKRNQEWIQLTRGLLFYYGTMKIGQLAKLVEKYTEKPVNFAAYLLVIRDLEVYDYSVNMSKHLFSHYLVNDPEQLQVEHESRPEVEYYPLTKAQALKAGEDGYVERHEGYRSLTAFLRMNWSMNEQDAEDIVSELVDQIRQNASLSDLISSLQEQLDFDEMGLVQRLIDVVVVLYNKTRVWELKGYSPEELGAQRASSQPTHPMVSPMNAMTTKSALQQPAAPGVVYSFQTKAKVGRNDPCPCGSGKKFKKCCGG
jgi:hypothetical protein